MQQVEREDGWKKIVLLLFCGWITIWIYRTMLTPVFEEIQETVGPQSDMKMGLISSLYFFGYTFTQIPGGILMDKIGKRKVLVPGFVLFSAGIGVIAFASSMGMIYAGSLMAGIATGTYYSGAFSLASERVPKKNKFFATAVINNGCAVGMIIGLTASSYLTKQFGYPWQWLAGAAAVLALLMAPACLLILKEDKSKRIAAGAPEATELLEVTGASRATGKSQLPGSKTGMKCFFSIELISSYMLYFSTCYGYYMIVTWLPSFLEQEKNLTGTAVGLSASIVAVASIPGALLISRIADRKPEKKIAMITSFQIGAAVMLVLAATFSSVTLLLLCLALYGISGKQAIDPLILPHVTELNSKGSLSTGLGVFNFFGMSSSILAPIITGFISDQAGSKVMGFYLAAGLLLASAVIFYMINRRPIKENRCERSA